MIVSLGSAGQISGREYRTDTHLSQTLIYLVKWSYPYSFWGSWIPDITRLAAFCIVTLFVAYMFLFDEAFLLSEFVVKPATSKATFIFSTLSQLHVPYASILHVANGTTSRCYEAIWVKLSLLWNWNMLLVRDGRQICSKNWFSNTYIYLWKVVFI